MAPSIEKWTVVDSCNRIKISKVKWTWTQNSFRYFLIICTHYNKTKLKSCFPWFLYIKTAIASKKSLKKHWNLPLFGFFLIGPFLLFFSLSLKHQKKFLFSKIIRFKPQLYCFLFYEAKTFPICYFTQWSQRHLDSVKNCTWLVALWTFIFQEDRSFYWAKNSLVDKKSNHVWGVDEILSTNTNLNLWRKWKKMMKLLKSS